MKQNTLANLRETKYIKNPCKGNFIILLFSILLNNNARLFNFIGQSFLLNNTKIFDIRQNTLANSGEPEYIKNTTVKGGNLITSVIRLIFFTGLPDVSDSLFLEKNDLTNNFLFTII